MPAYLRVFYFGISVLLIVLSTIKDSGLYAFRYIYQKKLKSGHSWERTLCIVNQLIYGRWQRYRRILAAQGYSVSRCDFIRKSKLILGGRSVDLILLDLNLMTEVGPPSVHDFSGIDCVLLVNERQAYLAAETMRAGAIDYIIKPFGGQQMLDVVKGARRLR